ncbi:MAG TPA: adenylate/guanylate cyclase domain-containing protein [Candidatus Methylacidiphilales bacterium]|nr:adenylate/guanylate cyclase domain-containing protein [Candidatus Methylacidiphilales bacterium]
MSLLSFSQLSPNLRRRLKLTAFLMAAALLVGIGFALLQRMEFFQRTEWRMFDVWMTSTKAERPLAEGLAVVDFNESALQLANRDQELDPSAWRWPWPREAYVQMLAYLYCCGAKEVYIDILFHENRDRFWDDQIPSIAKVLPVRFASNRLDKDVKTGRPLAVLFQPVFEVGLQEDSHDDGVVRRSPDGRLLAWSGTYSDLVQGINGKSGSLSYVNAYYCMKGGRKIMMEAMGADVSQPSEAIKKLNEWEGWGTDAEAPAKARQMLDGWLKTHKVPEEEAVRLRGKTVVIGASAQAVFDLKKFPVTGQYPDPGMLAHITRISNDMQGSFFSETSPALHAAYIILACLLVGVGLSISSSVYAQISVGGLGVAGVLGFSYLLFVNSLWLPPVAAACAVVATLTLGLAVYYFVEGRQRQLVSSLFGNFVSDRVLQNLIDNPEKLKRLGGDRMNCTILFSDLSGFTDLTEQLTQRDQAALLVDILNDYFTQMSSFVLNSDGYVDKYIGDALMAVYGVPDPTPDHARRACFAALDCVERMKIFAPQIESEYGVKLFARYGINTGDAVVGLMGSLRKTNYTVIGDPVNLASRLEGANKPFGTTIMIGEETYAQAKDDIEVRPIANLIVKGKLTAVRTYELLARKGQLTEEQARARQSYWEAFEAFGRREWDSAEAGLRESIRILGEDPLSQAYLKSIAYYRKNPPPSGWQGIFKLDEK